LSQAEGINEEEETARNRLRMLVEAYYDVQDVRIRTANRLRTVGEVRSGYPGQLKKVEDRMKKEILEEVEKYPIWREWLMDVKGIGPCLAGGLLAWIGDIGKFPTVSKLWAYCGLHVVDGMAPRKKRGAKVTWNPKLRTHAWKIGQSFMKVGGYYKELYKKIKSEYLEKMGKYIEDPSLCPKYKDCVKRLRKRSQPACRGHIDAMSRRKTVKIFLQHLWVKWRELEGLPVTEPYPIAKMGHKDYVAPP